MKIYIKIVTSVTAALLLSACGGSSSGTSSAINGKLVDAPVAGADYHCGAIQDKTKGDGSFECKTYPVIFSVGGVELGTIQQIPKDGNVTPQDLLGVARDTYNAEVENMGIFLQSLDDDGDIDKVITIDPHSVEELQRIHADIQKMTEDEIMQLLAQVQAVHIATRDEAIRHMHEHLDPLIHNNHNDNNNTGQSSALPVDPVNMPEHPAVDNL